MSKIKYSVIDIANIVNGQILGSCSQNLEIKELLIDSRQLIYPGSSLFFAITGKRNNGHNYIEELYSKGVKAFVVEQVKDLNTKLDKASFIIVPDTVKALQKLAAFHRDKFNIPVIGITGSNGKTIIKEWLYQLLNEDYNIIRSPKSFNSQTGVPLSVWQINQDNNLAIFEAGISEPDEMQNLQQIIKPTLGIFTNIGQAHAINFSDINQKIDEKLKLFYYVDTLIYCSDYSDIERRIISNNLNNKINIFTWSKTTKTANFSILDIKKTRFSTIIKGYYNNKNIEITIPFIDDASIENAINCWCLMLQLNYENDIIASRMLQLTPVAMRLELKEGINNCSIINDSYNSDIKSLAIALDFLNQQTQHNTKTLILSDILQSRCNSDELYSEVATLCKEKGIKRITGIGNIISKYQHYFDLESEFYADTDTFLNNIKISSFQNQTILLKGARPFQFERISKVLEQKVHETVMEINLTSLIHNLNYFRNLLKPETKVMAIVKAFSYGSGSYEVANALQFHNIDYLAVAYADEGIELRKAGIVTPIMVMNPEVEGFSGIIKYRLEPEIYSFRLLSLLEKTIKDELASDSIVPIHIKIDTGMHRLGFESNDINKLVARVKRNPNLKIASVFSHLAGADDEKHDAFTLSQIDKFDKSSFRITDNFDYPILRHILNTAGVVRFPEAQFDMVRLGLGLYGIHFDKSKQKELQNVHKLKSCISQIKQIPVNESIGYDRAEITSRDTTIAVIPVGYADGLNRSLSKGKGKIWVKGQLAPIIGNICMDMCMINITNIDCKEGDEVIIFGDEYPIYELAKTMNTIPYEVLTSISRRVKRVYYQE